MGSGGGPCFWFPARSSSSITGRRQPVDRRSAGYRDGRGTAFLQGEKTMIGYVTLGTNDVDRAAAFYDALLGTIGAKRFM